MRKPENDWAILRQRDFTGGENRNVLPELMQPNQLLLAQNFVRTADGLLQTRLGKTKINDVSLGDGKVISIHRFAKEDGTKLIVAQHGTKLYGASWDGSSLIEGSFTEIASGLNAAKFRSRVWRDTLILTNGVDNPKKLTYSGSTFTLADLSGSPPKSKVCEVYAGKLWLVDVANPNFLRFSALENYDSWDALDVIKIRTGDGDYITGLAALPDGMVVFKNKSTWALYGTSRTDIRVTGAPIADVGCISADTIVTEVGTGLFLGEDNIYQFDLTQVTPVGESHKNVITNISRTDKQAAFAVPLIRTGQVPMVFGDGTILNIEARYGGILTWAGLNAGSLSVCNATGDDGSLIIGDNAAGYFYKLDNVVDDAGAPINSLIQTSYLDYGLTKKKVFRYFSPEIEPISAVTHYIYMTYDIDYALIGGLSAVTSVIPNILDWGIDNWNEAVWGNKILINETYWMHGARGNRVSYGIKTQNRIKFLGYTTKFRQAGAQ